VSFLTSTALPKHTNGCSKWEAVIGVPPSEFDFDRHFQRGLWASGAVEGTDYVRCLLCAKEGTEARVKRLADHLKRLHGGMSRAQYGAQFPGAPVVARSSGAKRQETTQLRYGVDNVGQTDEVKAKTRRAAQAKYGVSHHLQATEVIARRAETNLEKYGTENVFASEEIKAKIRATNLERYGAENPQQAAEIRRRTEQTTLARHGASSFLHSPAWCLELARKRAERERRQREELIRSANYQICPHCDEAFTRITSRHKAICDGWPDTEIPEPCLCGHESTSLTQMKRHRQICVVWTLRDAGAVARARYLQTMLERHGVVHPLQSEEIQSRMAATNRERYGVDNVFEGDSPFYAEIQAALVGKRPVLRGDDNPFAWPQVKEKILRECLAKVGHEFPDFPEAATTVEDLVERYGMTHPMQDRDFARTILLAQGTNREPNGPERMVQVLEPRLMYTGDRKFWRWLPRLGRHKNPDFVLPGPVPDHPFRDLRKVVEVNGDWWHSEKFTDMWPFEHESELVAAYAEVGLECLVVWESEVKSDPEGVRARLRAFLGGSLPTPVASA
jgi:hypothetical protein